jgi:hypothetical protein
VVDLILIRQDTCGKLAKPTRGPYRLNDVARQHVNGTVMVDLNHTHKTFNICTMHEDEGRKDVIDVLKKL